jgi:hypothetical protein
MLDLNFCDDFGKLFFGLILGHQVIKFRIDSQPNIGSFNFRPKFGPLSYQISHILKTGHLIFGLILDH